MSDRDSGPPRGGGRHSRGTISRRGVCCRLQFPIEPAIDRNCTGQARNATYASIPSSFNSLIIKNVVGMVVFVAAILLWGSILFGRGETKS